MSILRLLRIILVFLGVLIHLQNTVHAEDLEIDQAPSISNKCDIEEEGYVLFEDLMKFEKRILKLPIQSSEGNEVRVYKKSNKTIAISFGIYGETGRTEYMYYFNTKQNGKILVAVTDSNYTLPILARDTELGSSFSKSIATETKTMLAICENYPVNYMSENHIENIRSNAIEILTLIRKNL